MKSIKKTYLIVKLEIDADADIGVIITDMEVKIKHKDIYDSQVVGSSDEIIFDD
jgi:hypothetical protein